MATVASAANSPLHRLAVMAFLGFALVVWPTYLPFSLRLMERTPARRQAQTALPGLVSPFRRPRGCCWSAGERDTLTSVWCFFAAILSAQILVAFRREQRWNALPSDERLFPSRP